MMTVYGFSKERLVTRQTCMVEVLLAQKEGQVVINLSARALNGDHCLHRDTLANVVLEEEKDPRILKRDDLFFKNLDALEYTLTVATFDEHGVEGDWLVTQDDLYSSNAPFRDFFMLENESVVEKTNATVFYRIKYYDMVGPSDFHKDRTLDLLRSGAYDG